MDWHMFFRGAEYILAVIGLLDIIWAVWKAFLQRSPVGGIFMVARLDGDEEQVEGQARTLLRTVESWRNHGERVQLLVVPSKPACGAMLQRMEQDGAALHVCAEEKALQWLKQLEQRAT